MSVRNFISFAQPLPQVSGLKPLGLRLRDVFYDTACWKEVPLKCAKALLDSVRFRDRLLQRVRNVGRFSPVSAGLRKPERVEAGLWMETNLSADSCLKLTLSILKLADYPLADASVDISMQPAAPGPDRMGGNKKSDFQDFLACIQTIWPDGFDFSVGAVRLLEARCGKMTGEIEAGLKSAMFRLRGKLWIHPECVAGIAAFKDVSNEIEHAIEEAGFASVAFVAARVLSDAPRLHDGRERCEFVKFIAHRNKWKIVEHGDIALIAPEDFNGEVELPRYCDFARECVQEGVIQVETLTSTSAFANVTQHEMVSLMREYEPTVIPERGADGVLSFKMLSEYYLPDDFADAVGDALARAGGEGVPPTAASLSAALSERYGCDFAQDYALDPACSLKWAIAAVWRMDEGNPPRTWQGEGARARFVPAGDCKRRASVPQGGNGKAALPDLVEAAFSGAFSNEDFWKFASQTYGLAATREAQIAQLGYLAPRFIRLDRERWMSLANFRATANWDGAKADAMAGTLRSALGSAAFLPMASLGAAVLDALPEIPFRWTPELAASVAALLCPGVHVANHGAASFAVTALLVPRPVAPDETVRRVLGVYAARNPHERSVEAAFDFLRENSVKFRLTKNCRAEIEAFLAEAEREGR